MQQETKQLYRNPTEERIGRAVALKCAAIYHGGRASGDQATSEDEVLASASMFVEWLNGGGSQ